MAIGEVRSPDLNRPLGVFSQAISCQASGTLLFISGLTAGSVKG